MIIVKKKKEIEKMREGGKILSLILERAKDRISEGVKTIEIDNLVNRLCLKHKVRPSFLNYSSGNKKGNGFPASICISLNEEIVHGIPTDRVIKDGDVVSLDFGVLYKGYHTDKAVTLAVGEVDKRKKELIKTTEKALMEGIKSVKEGNYIGDISHAIEKEAKKAHLSVIKNLVGHGIGKSLHETPPIPNFGDKDSGLELKAGMTLAIEPMLSLGNFEILFGNDNWTVSTVDGSISAHFEHTVLVTKSGYEILTQR